MSIEAWTLLIAIVTALVCSLCGSLLLVGRQAMVSEGLSHAVLPGLVLAFAAFRSYDSPWLIVMAAASGLVMVWATEALSHTRLIDPDAGLGIVFAAMFSTGILIVSTNLRHTHFHADCIIDGNLALAPLDSVRLLGFEPVPKSMISMSSMLLLVVAFIAVCYKELKIMIFDPILAKRVGLRPVMMKYGWLAIVSLTTVAAFNVAGSVLIVALMIAPPATAFLITNRLSLLLSLASLIAVLSALTGHVLAKWMDISPTGPMASVAGGIFLAVFLFWPHSGLLGVFTRRSRKIATLRETLALELASNTQDRVEAEETLRRALGISGSKAAEAIDHFVERRLLTPDLHLTEQGRATLPLQ
ncbi:MAG: metal ABC transporter permease [Aureliella sp.]